MAGVSNKSSTMKDKPNHRDRLHIAKKQCNSLQVNGPIIDSNTEFVGTASIIVTGVKDEPLDTLDDQNPLNDFDRYWNRRCLEGIDMKKPKLRLNINLREKKGRAFNMLNTKGLPWSFPPTISEANNESTQGLMQTDHAGSTSSKGSGEIAQNCNIRNRDSMDIDTSNTNAIPLNDNVTNGDSIDIDTGNTNAIPLNDYSDILDCDSDENECEIIGEICIAVTGVNTEIEQRHSLLQGNSHVESNEHMFPLTGIIFGDPSSDTNIQKGLPECDMSAACGKEQQAKTIQYTIDKLPTPSSILDKNSDSSFLRITSHTCKPLRNIRCFQQEAIENGPWNEEYTTTITNDRVSRGTVTNTHRNIRPMLIDIPRTPNSGRTTPSTDSNSDGEDNASQSEDHQIHQIRPARQTNLGRANLVVADSNSERQAYRSQFDGQQVHQTTSNRANRTPSDYDPDGDGKDSQLDDHPVHPIRPVHQTTLVYYTCDKCNAAPFPTRQDLRSHKMTHGLCPLCPEEHFTTQEMMNHLQDIHNTFRCTECDIIFGDETSLGRHNNRHHLEDRSDLGFGEESNLTRHNSSHSRRTLIGDGPILAKPSKRCSRRISIEDEADLSRLNNSHSRRFSISDGANRARPSNRHYGPSRQYLKQFACTKCYRIYSTEGRFLLHLRTHTTVRNKCLECQRDFEETLTYHRSRSYFFGVMCVYCRNQLLHKVNVSLIKKKMRKIKFRYLCLICKTEFPSLDKLEGHMGFHSQQARDQLRALQNRQ